MFESTLNQQKKYYEDNPAKRPDKSKVNGIISYYANINAGVAGSMALIPGPFGLLSVVPEIAITVSNQIKMIYDLALAYKKESFVTKELVAAMMVSSLGSAGIGIIAMKGSQVLVKRASLRFFQQIIQMLAGKIAQKTIKAAIARWLPIVGPIAMATWARITTSQIGTYAQSILEKDIQVENEVIDVEFQEVDATPTTSTSESQSSISQTEAVEKAKIYAFINLMNIDNDMDKSELEIIEGFINNAPLSDDANPLWS